MIHLRIISACLLATWLLAGFAHASAPHPRVRRMIKEGIIPEPYYLRHLTELRRAGVNAPWVRRPPVGLHKILGPDRFTGMGAGQPLTGTLNALVILVDFSDSTHKADVADFDSLMFAESYHSVRHYYRAVSYDNLDIVTMNLPSELGWVRADSAYAYYVNGESGIEPSSYPRNAQKLVEEAVLAVNSLVDFSKYDNDGDKEVDALFVVHAGPGAEYTGSDDDIWSHAWFMHDTYILDGVNISPYAMVPEYWDTTGDMTIGVYAHELGHALFDLPDLYDRDDPDSPNASSGLDLWSLMAAGSWNGPQYMGISPAWPDAWCRQQMGYATTQNVTTNLLDQPIVDVATMPDIYRLWAGGVLGAEYFLVENRQQVGYDYYLPGSGLLIYHVDENVGTQNDNEWYPGHTGYGHYLVALEQADGLYELEKSDTGWADGGDPFPGSTTNRNFTAISSPGSVAYDDAWTGVAITNITPADAMTIVADLGVNAPAGPTLLSIADVPGDQGGKVTVTWESAPADTTNSSAVSAYTAWLRDTSLAVVDANATLPYEGGQWIFVGHHDATGGALYSLEVPTLADSNSTAFHRSYFLVAAHASDSLVASPSLVMSGYSIDNLPPDPPTRLEAVIAGADSVLLTWIPTNDPDLQDYRVYRGQSQNFFPTQTDLYHAATNDTFFHDAGLSPGDQFYYRVAAVDINGNVSEYTAAVTPGVMALAERAGDLPHTYALHPNYPNPFNPITTLRFDLPEAAWVSIIVFDLRGREVVRLVEGLRPPGCHQVLWRGRSADGRALPSGIYFARMAILSSAGETPGFSSSVKMLLLR